MTRPPTSRSGSCASTASRSGASSRHRAGTQDTLVAPGFYLREVFGDGSYEYTRLRGRALFWHRLLWGFTRGLVDAR